MKEKIIKLREALQEAVTGLEWRIETDPMTIDESDYEALNEWKKVLALSTPPQAEAKEGEKVNGFIEHIGNESDYDSPIGTKQDCDCRVYCDKCRAKFIIGTLGYNGGFTANTGQFCDLRNQVWVCSDCQSQPEKQEEITIKDVVKSIVQTHLENHSKPIEPEGKECKNCNGTGRVLNKAVTAGESTCIVCWGTGYIVVGGMLDIEPIKEVKQSEGEDIYKKHLADFINFVKDNYKAGEHENLLLEVGMIGQSYNILYNKLSEVKKEIEGKDEKIKNLEFMIKHGLDWKDMESDISPMHEI